MLFSIIKLGFLSQLWEIKVWSSLASMVVGRDNNSTEMHFVDCKRESIITNLNTNSEKEWTTQKLKEKEIRIVSDCHSCK